MTVKGFGRITLLMHMFVPVPTLLAPDAIHCPVF